MRWPFRKRSTRHPDSGPVDPSRFRYWAAWNYDPSADPSHVLNMTSTGTGLTFRYEDSPCWFMRWDLQTGRGSILGKDGRWYWSELPGEDNVRGGMDGYEISADVARQFAEILGYPYAMDVDVVYPDPHG